MKGNHFVADVNGKVCASQVKKLHQERRTHHSNIDDDAGICI